MGLKKEAYKHGYSGSCGPDGVACLNSSTFSVGCFQWLPKSNGKGLKKSAVKFRVKGFSSKPKKVYAHAEIICRQLDNGEKLHRKSCTV